MPTSVEQIKALREETGVSVAACKQALESAGGDLDAARAALMAAGGAVAAKKSSRTLGAGIIAQYIHTGGSIGTLLELASETDFVAKNEQFVQLASNLAMHVAAFEPADVPTLLEQPFIKEPGQTVADVIKAQVQKFGERIEVVRFVRLAVGQ